MSSIVVAGDTSGTITIAAPAVAGSGTLTLPVATDTLAGIAATQTLTNKTLTSPALSGTVTGTYTLGGTPTLTAPALGTVASGVISACTSNGMVMVAPALGTPASGVLTNCTGVSVASVSGTLAVANGGTGVTTKTGTGAVVLGTSPTLTTPTFNSASLATISGTAPLYMCRAWVNFQGTGTVAIRGSGNVSSITDGGTGKYTVNFTTAMPDASFSAVANYNILNTGVGTSNDGQASCYGYATGSVSMVTMNGASTLLDMTMISCAVFR